ncbi:FliM/FliN family flagellar motor C-terminal domain-containing protein [Pseudomonas turukhanskensis]|uniref:FliM/FliN family flagellar motor C-terminal domain-containing protein n=1 Tax=Pseudomonas turukhanskensis TaxID=1806536 RepID=UPI0022F2B17F|nr:FliM/FliN family flagellar motor C-terminal domain-containing protein [Pseudomonas turukhanskensis]
MTGHSKVHHRVPAESLTRLKPHKLGRHYHKIPQHIFEVASKYPRIIGDYFLRNYRINLELVKVDVLEERASDPDCIYKSIYGKVGFAIDRPLLTEALECYYGGTGLPSEEAPPVSTSEQRMRNRLGIDVTQIFARALLSGSTLGNLTPHENDFDPAVWEYVAEFTYLSHLSGTQSSIFLYLDNQLVDELTARLSGPASSTLAGNPAKHIQHLPVRLECVVAALQMPLSQVLALQVNDILMVRLLEHTEVRINQHKLFRGTLFEEDGSLFVTSLESVKTP